MKAIEFVATRLALLGVFAIGLTVISIMLAWHYLIHGEMPQT